ncbi:hypothetical protein VP01_1606g8 [Puccinia sorghi]|uniref:PX domain-containing protein n=1 Tax=Puccinia sorghi TaxID=27349 RepID=A0A0L6VHU1_9BASI|nr:hypothetical protein VP01_1606g8 [Puccinia sorghi]
MSFYPTDSTIEEENPFADLPSNNPTTTTLYSFTTEEQEPFQDIIQSENNYLPNDHDHNHHQDNDQPEQDASPEEPEEPEQQKELEEPKTPLFRPFGVSATLSSNSDQPFSPEHPTPTSRPALPDILGGGTPSSSLLLPDSRATLPAFKRSSPKTTTTNNSIATSTQSPRRNNQAITQPKPYRPLGLKIPQSQPIIIQPPPAPSNTESNQNHNPKSDSPQKSTTSTALEPSSHETNPINSENKEPISSQKDHPVNPVNKSLEKEQNPTSLTNDLSPQNQTASKETNTGLPTPSTTQSNLLASPNLDHEQATQTSQSSDQLHQGNPPSNPEPHHDQATIPSSEPPGQPAQATPSGLEPKPSHHIDTDSEDERPLASVRECLVQQQQQQQGRTPPMVNPVILPSVPNTSHHPAPPLPLYKCSVGDPQKMGMINDIHTVYTVKTIATDPNSSGPLKAPSTVLRRFRDFVWLFDALVSNNPGIIVPPIPDKNLRHRFQEGFIAARRVALEFFLQKTVNHPMLTSDPDLKLFLESDAFSLEIKHRRQDSSHQTGWLANIAGPRFVETDEFFENRKIELETLEGQLKVLQGSLTAASKMRRAMAQSLSQLAEALQVLSTSDLSKPVRGTIEKLAGLHRQAHQWALDQATNELESLITTVESYARLTNSVRLTFNGRVKSWDKLQHALNHLKKIQANHEKIKRSCAPNDQSTALMYSLAELEEAERRTHDARNEFADVSKLIKAEFQRFDQEKVEDFKLSICTFVDGLTNRQRQVVKVWQEYYQLLQHLSKHNADATSAPHRPTNTSSRNNTNDTGGGSTSHYQHMSNKNDDNSSHDMNNNTSNGSHSNADETGGSQPVPVESTSAPTPPSPAVVAHEPETQEASSSRVDLVSSPDASGLFGGQKDGHHNDDHDEEEEVNNGQRDDNDDDSLVPSPLLKHDHHQPLLVPDDAAVWADY